MKLFQNRQEKDLLIAEAKTVLFDIQRLTNQKNSEIAADLGISYRSLYGLEKGNQFSNQLLAALRLKLENLKLTARVTELESALRIIGTVKYPKYEASHSSMNDAESNFEKGQREAAAEENDDLTGRELRDASKKKPKRRKKGGDSPAT